MHHDGPIEVFDTGLLALYGALSASGQSTAVDIKARLKNKPLYLRGRWRDSSLKFDADGKLVGNSDPVSFTLSGFDFESAHLKSNKLIIDGKRMGVEFIRNTPKRVGLDSSIKIEIAAPPSGEYGSALDAIFADGLTEMASSMPFYWQRWAKRTLLPQPTDSTPASPKGDVGILHVGGSVSTPQLKQHKEAQFNDVARHLRYGGITVVGFVVGTDGLPTKLHVIQPLGLGLDEQAMASVQAYAFAPAIRDGKPVPVEVNVEVNFQIY